MLKDYHSRALRDGETVYMNRTGAIDVNEVANWLKGGNDEV